MGKDHRPANALQAKQTAIAQYQMPAVNNDLTDDVQKILSSDLLPPTRKLLLVLLYQHLNKVVTKDEILEYLGLSNKEGLRAMIYFLRKHIRQTTGFTLISYRSHGYMLSRLSDNNSIQMDENCYYGVCLKNKFLQHGNEVIPVTGRQFEMLQLFFTRKEEFITSSELAMKIYGTDGHFEKQIIRTFAHHLRDLLRPLGLQVTGLHRVGYVLYSNQSDFDIGSYVNKKTGPERMPGSPEYTAKKSELTNTEGFIQLCYDAEQELVIRLKRKHTNYVLWSVLIKKLKNPSWEMREHALEIVINKYLELGHLQYFQDGRYYIRKKRFDGYQFEI